MGKLIFPFGKGKSHPEMEEAILIRWDIPKNCNECFIKDLNKYQCYFMCAKNKNIRSPLCPLEKTFVKKL